MHALSLSSKGIVSSTNLARNYITFLKIVCISALNISARMYVLYYIFRNLNFYLNFPLSRTHYSAGGRCRFSKAVNRGATVARARRVRSRINRLRGEKLRFIPREENVCRVSKCSSAFPRADKSARVICRRWQRGKGDERRDGTDRGRGEDGGNGSGNKKVRKKPAFERGNL